MGSLLAATGQIVPRDPPLQSAVAPNYERFDGLDEIGQVPGNGIISTPFGVSYGESPDPGRVNAPFTLGHGIAGKVGSVGASPYPVATQNGPNRTAETLRSSVSVSQLTTQFRMGPGGSGFQGIAQSVQMTEIQQGLPAPDPLASIYLGG